MPKNANLTNAKKAKNDEFYTQLCDIEAEVGHYWDKLKGKRIFCNCDDPEWSNFWRYFDLNFDSIGIEALVSTHYEPGGTSYLLEILRDENGKKTDPIKMPLQGDGDFRSEECVALLDECDVVVTNPPFSLFREYVAMLVQHGKQFLIIGNKNAITYKEIFPLIKENKIWYGPSITGGDREFGVPDDIELTFKNPRIDANGRRYVRVPGVHWFTNLDHKRRHEPLILVKKYYDDPTAYPKYDNYDAINVDKTVDIPEDYFEHIGVPITFLDKYCPEQFEIVGATESEGVGFSNGLFRQTDRQTVQRDAGYGERKTGLQKIVHKTRITVVDGRAVIYPQEGIDLYKLAEQYAGNGFTYCNGVMGVPITFLDRYCLEQFEIVWIASGHFKTTCPDVLQKYLGYKDIVSDVGTKGYGIVHGHQEYHRILIRRNQNYETD